MNTTTLITSQPVQTIIDRDILPGIDAKISSDTRHPIIILNVMSIASTIITGVYAKYTTQLQHLKVARISYGVSLLSVVLTALLAIRICKQIILLSSLREAVFAARNNQINRYYQIMQRDPYSFSLIESLREHIPFGNYLLRKGSTQQYLQDRQARLFGHLPLHQQLEDLHTMATTCHLVTQENRGRYTGNEPHTKQSLRTLKQLRRERLARENEAGENSRLLSLESIDTLIEATKTIKQNRLQEDPTEQVTLTTHALTQRATEETVPPWPEGAHINELDEMLTRFDTLNTGGPHSRRQLATLIRNVKTRTPWSLVPQEPTAQTRFFDLMQSHLLWINRVQRDQMSKGLDRDHAKHVLRDLAEIAVYCGGGVSSEVETIYLAETGQLSANHAEGSDGANQFILKHWDTLKLMTYRNVSDQIGRGRGDGRHAQFVLANALENRGVKIPVQNFTDDYTLFAQERSEDELYNEYVDHIKGNMLQNLRDSINNDLRRMLEPWRGTIGDTRYEGFYNEAVRDIQNDRVSSPIALQQLAPKRQEESEEAYKRRFQEAKKTLEPFAPKIGTESPEAFERRRAEGLELVKSWTTRGPFEDDQDYETRCTRAHTNLVGLAAQMSDYQRRYNQGVQLRGEIQQLLLHTVLDYEFLKDEQLTTLEESKRTDTEEVERKKEAKAKNLIKAEEDEKWFNAVIKEAEAALTKAGGPLTIEEETRLLEEAQGDEDLSKLNERKQLSKYISDFRQAFRLAQSPASLKMLPKMPCFKNLPQEIGERLKLGIAAKPSGNEYVDLEGRLSRKEEARQRSMLFWESPINDSDDEEESYVAPPANANYLMQESKDLDGNGMPHIFLTDHGMRVLAWGMDLIH